MLLRLFLIHNQNVVGVVLFSSAVLGVGMAFYGTFSKAFITSYWHHLRPSFAFVVEVDVLEGGIIAVDSEFFKSVIFILKGSSL